MGRAKVVVAVAALMTGATGAGILTGAALVAGGLWAWTVLAPHPVTATPAPAVAAVDVIEETPAPPTPVVAAAAPASAPAVATSPRLPRAGTMTRGGSTTPAPTAPSGDLLADEDEWEAMGFEEAPDVAPATPPAEPDDAEELDAILEDLDAQEKPRRGR